MEYEVSTNPRWIAVWGLALCLPGFILFCLFLLHVNPRVLLELGNALGSAIIFLVVVFLPTIAFSMNMLYVKRAMDADADLIWYAFNLMPIILSLFIMGTFVIGFMISQYPCVTGVLNC